MHVHAHLKKTKYMHTLRQSLPIAVSARPFTAKQNKQTCWEPAFQMLLVAHACAHMSWKTKYLLGGSRCRNHVFAKLATAKQNKHACQEYAFQMLLCSNRLVAVTANHCICKTNHGGTRQTNMSRTCIPNVVCSAYMCAEVCTYVRIWKKNKMPAWRQRLPALCVCM